MSTQGRGRVKTGLNRNDIEVVGDKKGRLEGKLGDLVGGGGQLKIRTAKFQPMRALGNIKIEESSNCNGRNSHLNSGLPSRSQDLHVTNYGNKFKTDQ